MNELDVNDLLSARRRLPSELIRVLKRPEAKGVYVAGGLIRATIRDLNLGRMSVTNDAENVVANLRKHGILEDGRRLFYYDSEGDLDEIVWTTAGDVSFAPWERSRHGQP